MHPAGVLYRFDQIFDFDHIRVVLHHRFFAFQRNMDFLNTLHFFQCRPHRGCTAASRHASDFQGDGCFLCRQRRRNCSHQEQHAHGSNDRSRVHIRYLRRRLYRAPAFARAAFWDDVLGTSKKPKSAKTLADGLTVPTDLVGSPAPFRSVVSVLWLCGSGGCFAVEPRTDQRSDDDLYQAYRKADGQNMSREKMECNRGDRCKEVPEAPDGRTGAERGFRTGAIAWANGGIEPDGEDAPWLKPRIMPQVEPGLRTYSVAVTFHE